MLDVKRKDASEKREMGDLEFLPGNFPRSSDIENVPSTESYPSPLPSGESYTPLPPRQNIMASVFPGSEDPLPYPNPEYSPVSYFSLPADSSINQNSPMDVTMLKPLEKLSDFRITSFNCVDVAHHLDSCPVCKKVHRTNNPILVGIIVILIVIALVLGKKMFE